MGILRRPPRRPGNTPAPGGAEAPPAAEKCGGGDHRGRDTARGAGQRRRALGAEGEARAAAYLQRRGYLILDRNLRVGGVEIDLIATRGRVVAFVEVKTRRNRRAGAPEEAVDRRKRARLAHAATAWLCAAPRSSITKLRFDVMACEVRAGRWTIRHWPGAFDLDEL